jgi:hypothetical protein
MTIDKKEATPRLRMLVLAVALGSILKVSSAAALSESEAATVIHLLETLREEFGEFAYDASIADDWFEQDAEHLGLIEAAGFTAESWRRALDDTYRGFLANIPEAEIRSSFANARLRVERSKTLSAQQKQAALRLTDEQEQQVLRLRREGQPHAATVRLLTERLRTLDEQFRTME